MMDNVKKLWANVISSFSWKEIKASRNGYAALLLIFPPLWLLFGNPYQAGLAALILLAATHRMHWLYMAFLRTRIGTQNTVMWDVEINQVKVGEIPDADYAMIRHEAFTDVRVYVAQLLNLLGVALNSIFYYIRAVPIYVFWTGAVLAIFSPETIRSALLAVQHATPNELELAASTVGFILVMSAMMAVLLTRMFGLSGFGFVNRFDEAIGTAIRKNIGVAIEGSIVLVRWTDGVPHLSNEIASFVESVGLRKT